MLISRRNLLALGVVSATGCGGGGDNSAPATNLQGLLQADTTPQARYRVRFRNHWTAAAFPTSFPPTAHLTGLVGATHGADVVFWASGRVASQGIQNVAERGSKTALLDEVALAIAAGTAEFSLSAGGVALGVDEGTLEFDVSTRFPLVTLVSMLGPSPDWFTGVAGLSMLNSGAWQQRIERPLRVYDSGTDDGVTFLSPNAVTAPRGIVHALSTGAADSDLLDGVHRTSGTVLASMVFERLA